MSFASCMYSVKLPADLPALRASLQQSGSNPSQSPWGSRQRSRVPSNNRHELGSPSTAQLMSLLASVIIVAAVDAFAKSGLLSGAVPAHSSPKQRKFPAHFTSRVSVLGCPGRLISLPQSKYTCRRRQMEGSSGSSIPSTQVRSGNRRHCGSRNSSSQLSTYPGSPRLLTHCSEVESRHTSSPFASIQHAGARHSACSSGGRSSQDAAHPPALMQS